MNFSQKQYIGKKFNRWTLLKIEMIYEEHRKRNIKYGLCKCDCGKIKRSQLTQIINGYSKSCGCGIKHPHGPYGESNANKLFTSYIHNAKRRNLIFDLSKEQFLKLTKECCYYCGANPSNIHKEKSSYGEYIYNGIDRIDNSKGYIKTNVVACCEKCNRAKMKMTQEQFFNLVKRIYERHLK